MFSTYKCKVTFGFKYIIISCNIFAKYVLFSFSVILLICSKNPIQNLCCFVFHV